MFGWVSKSALPEVETIEWLFEVYGWLLARTGGIEAFRKERTIILPTDEFFPVPASLEPHDFATAMFQAIKTHAVMGGIACELAPLDEDPSASQLLGPGVAFSSSRSGAAGTFMHGGGVDRALISYAPSGVRNPDKFVATMAHELGHFLMHGFGEPAPGGPDAQEPATDVCAVFLGFGVFNANATFLFEQHSDGLMQGWSSSRLGYLGERPMSYALAIFLALQGLDVKAARGFLRSNIDGYVRNALLHLKKNRSQDLESLRRVLNSSGRVAG
jgi:hypothetical protein